MAGPKRKPSTGANKNPPILSHEFFIQNHADILSCVAIVFVVGLMAQVTNKFASPFVTLSYNVTTVEELQADPSRPLEYGYGIKDVLAVFFYTVICIIIHQVIQEYIVDKLTRRLHLSKLRTSRFSESAQLVAFYTISLIWAVDISFSKGYLLNYKSVWENYPHNRLAFAEKFFMILHIAHWVHTYAELYFQKVKKEDIPARLIYQTANLIIIVLAYVTNFHRLFLVLNIVESAQQLVFHAAKLLHYADKNKIANPLFNAYNIIFLVARVISVALSGYVMLLALKPTQISGIDFQQGNFNTPLTKIQAFALIVVLNFWMLVRFLTFHIRRRRERAEYAAQRRKQLAERRSKPGRSESSDEGGSENASPEVSPKAKNHAAVNNKSPKGKKSE